ncbi:hypothetical protein [Streptomyces sp. NPDC054783]
MAGNLYIRVAPGDTGSRPFNSCANAWASQSIWLDPPRPDNATAQVNQPSTIKVQVRNMGHTDIPFVKVHAYVMSPQIGLSSPAQAIVDFVSGPQTVPALDGAPDGVVFDCGPWTPTAAQLATTDQGHLCLFANAFQDRNLADPPYDGKDLTPGTDTFDICNDAHQGQRNITLIAVAHEMMHIRPIHFLVNPLPAGVEEAVLDLEPLEETELDTPALRDLLTSRRDITGVVDDKGHHRLLIDAGDGEQVPLRLSPHPLKYELETDGQSRGPRLRLNRHKDHQPRRAKLILQTDAKDPIGTLHAFDIVQRTAGGRRLGGIRMVTVVTATGH